LTPCVPVIVALAVAATALVEIVKVPVVAPAAIVTLAGVVAFELLDARFTTEPPGPAGPFKVAVPVDELPPITEAGDRVTVVSAAVAIVRLAV
jgi:hypothetical protein